MLQIGEVARQSGVGVETIRYYEREGLIPKPERTNAGYRLYPEMAVKQLWFIQHAKTLGFSLKEIGELIALKTTAGATCESVRAKAITKVDDIQRKIDALRKMKVALLPLIDQCQTSKPISDCPILNALEDDLE